MDILRALIYEEDKTLLKKMSFDFYPEMNEEQHDFIKKYHKKNFTYMNYVFKDIEPLSKKRLSKILK